jgi:hypothetical protein
MQQAERGLAFGRYASNVQERVMQAGQVVRLRPGGRISSPRTIPADASGIVICAYRPVVGGHGGPERIDVDFRQHGIVWAQPAEAFEPSEERAEPGRRDN